MKYLKNKGIPKFEKEETIQWLNAKLTDLYRDIRTIENAIEYLKNDINSQQIEHNSQEKSADGFNTPKISSPDTIQIKKGCRQLYDYNSKVCGIGGLCEKCKELEKEKQEYKFKPMKQEDIRDEDIVDDDNIIQLIDKKIKEMDREAFEHCFKKGKMCDECWEKKRSLMELRDEFEKGEK